ELTLWMSRRQLKEEADDFHYHDRLPISEAARSICDREASKSGGGAPLGDFEGLRQLAGGGCEERSAKRVGGIDGIGEVAKDGAGEGCVKIGAAGIASSLAELGGGPVDAPGGGRGLRGLQSGESFFDALARPGEIARSESEVGLEVPGPRLQGGIGSGEG